MTRPSKVSEERVTLAQQFITNPRNAQASKSYETSSRATTLANQENEYLLHIQHQQSSWQCDLFDHHLLTLKSDVTAGIVSGKADRCIGSIVQSMALAQD